MSAHTLFYNTEGRAVRVDFAFLYLSAMIGFLFIFSGKLDPDYNAYRMIYENAGGWLEAQGRDPLFVYIVGKTSSVISYEFFRYAICLAFGLALYRLVRNIKSIVGIKYGLLQVICLTPFIILKLHVQIREGAAILIWLIAITGNSGNITEQSKKIKFWLLAGISCTIHLSAVVLWIATIVFLVRDMKYNTKALMVFMLFAFYGAAMTTLGREFITTKILQKYSFYRDTGYDVDIHMYKIIYWSLFICLPLTAIAFFHRRAFFIKADIKLQPSVLGFVGTYGLIGFFLPVLFCVAIWGATEGDFSSALRIANTLLILLVMQLSITRPAKPLTWIIFFFSLSDAIRLILL